MPSKKAFTKSDEGKKVVNDRGETVGRILEVASGRAYVSPDPDCSNSMPTGSSGRDRDDGTYAIESDRIATITGDEAILKPP